MSHTRNKCGTENQLSKSDKNALIRFKQLPPVLSYTNGRKRANKKIAGFVFKRLGYEITEKSMRDGRPSQKRALFSMR
jgi:hypothetical protein